MAILYGRGLSYSNHPCSGNNHKYSDYNPAAAAKKGKARGQFITGAYLPPQLAKRGHQNFWCRGLLFRYRTWIYVFRDSPYPEIYPVSGPSYLCGYSCHSHNTFLIRYREPRESKDFYRQGLEREHYPAFNTIGDILFHIFKIYYLGDTSLGICRPRPFF